MQWIKLFNSIEEAESKLVLDTIFRVAIGHHRVCLFRNQSGIKAFNGKCPHAGASLSDGFVNDLGEIVCPLHSYRFSLQDGREKSGHSCELIFYPIDGRTDGLYLGF